MYEDEFTKSGKALSSGLRNENGEVKKEQANGDQRQVIHRRTAEQQNLDSGLF
jgi:hypothetical protein